MVSGGVGLHAVFAAQAVIACISLVSHERKMLIRSAYLLFVFMTSFILLTLRIRTIQQGVLITSPLLFVKWKNKSIFFILIFFLLLVRLTICYQGLKRGRN